MSGRFSRNERVAGMLRRELAVLIQRELKDPKVGFVGVSDVEVTRDLSLAKVYVTHYQPEQSAESLRALNRSSGFLRGRLGEMLRMRAIPELRFLHDDSVERGAHIDRLLNTIADAESPAKSETAKDEEE
ncbi:MAG: 30S ribosome-binding factor RbfA [Wenzhouxiangellaceae bacterium]